MLKEMLILAADDEPDALEVLELAIREALPCAKIACFGWPDDALDFVRNNPVDVAFLDIEMGGMNGLTMAKSLKEMNHQTNIVFVTGYSEYACQAISIRASGYVMKPATSEQIVEEVKNLRYPVEPDNTEQVRVKCFGSFGVFANGSPLLFSQAKTKELLALLVHKRGASVSNVEIATILWENRPYSNSVQTQTRQVRSQLIQLLRKAGIEDILCRARNSLAIDVKKISCDCYEFLEGKSDSVNGYVGEYMNEYSWAEFTTAYLNNRIK